MLAAYIGAIVLLVLKGVTTLMLANVDNENIAGLLDPFGAQALSNATKYWSVEEQNTLAIPFSGIILYNRLLWVGISLLIAAATYWRFKFSQFNNPVNFFWWRKPKESKSLASSPVLSISDNPIVILLIMNVVLLLVGTVMDITPAILIFTPIFLPIVTQIGMDPVHFGIVLVFNLCIGIVSPPSGSSLFVGFCFWGVSIEEVTRPLLIFMAGLIVTLLLVTYVPAITLFVPKLFGAM